MQPKLSTSDYPNFDLLPDWQQKKILRAIAKRLRQRARKQDRRAISGLEEIQ